MMSTKIFNDFPCGLDPAVAGTGRRPRRGLDHAASMTAPIEWDRDDPRGASVAEWDRADNSGRRTRQWKGPLVPDLTHLATSYVDLFRVDVPLGAFADHPPMRATSAIVELQDVPDERGTGSAKVHVILRGERIIPTTDGYTLEGSGQRQIFGLLEEPERFELCRRVVLASLERHGLGVDDFVAVPFLRSWDEFRSTLDVGAVNLGGAVSRYLHFHDAETPDVEDDRF